MKKVYKRILRSLENLAINVDKKKVYMYEKFAIMKKRKLYSHIKWSKEQKKEFTSYWKKNYGKKISSRWHKLYEAANGVHCVEYFPEILYSAKLEYMLNDFKYAYVFANKSFNSVLFNDKMDGVRVPKTFLFKNKGQYFDSNRNLISEKDAMNIASNVGFAVIKPTVDSSSGRDVKVVNIQNGKNARNGEELEQLFRSYGDNFIVQERINQHHQLSYLYPSSVNTVRMISYMCDNAVHTTPISLRIGGGGSEVDNIHAGGMSIAVSDEGFLSKYAYRLGYGDSFEKFDLHPNTNVVFDGYRLDFIPKMIEVAKKLHLVMSNLGMISWDFTVDADGDIIVVEANLKGQST